MEILAGAGLVGFCLWMICFASYKALVRLAVGVTVIGGVILALGAQAEHTARLQGDAIRAERNSPDPCADGHDSPFCRLMRGSPTVTGERQ